MLVIFSLSWVGKKASRFSLCRSRGDREWAEWEREVLNTVARVETLAAKERKNSVDFQELDRLLQDFQVLWRACPDRSRILRSNTLMPYLRTMIRLGLLPPLDSR